MWNNRKFYSDFVGLPKGIKIQQRIIDKVRSRSRCSCGKQFMIQLFQNACVCQCHIFSNRAAVITWKLQNKQTSLCSFLIELILRCRSTTEINYQIKMQKGKKDIYKQPETSHPLSEIQIQYMHKTFPNTYQRCTDTSV